MALLAIVVLDCVLLGTLHIAMQENRIAANRASTLQLRLTAEAGVRRAMGYWSIELDTMPAAGVHQVQVPPALTPGASVHLERIADDVFLIESVAMEPAPRVGRASARLLVKPPALPPDAEPAAAAVSSGTAVVVTSSGAVDTAVPMTCGESASVSITAPPFAVAIDPAASVAGPIGTPDSTALVHVTPRLLALAPSAHVAPGDTTVTDGSHVVVIAAGNVTVSGTVTGLIVAAGSITIEPGASMGGAVHAAGTITIAGAVHGDPCAVGAAVQASRLDRQRPAPGRAWLPSF